MHENRSSQWFLCHTGLFLYINYSGNSCLPKPLLIDNYGKDKNFNTFNTLLWAIVEGNQILSMVEAFWVSWDVDYFTNPHRSIFSILGMPWLSLAGFCAKTAKKLRLKELPKFGTYFLTSEKKKKACTGFLSNGIPNFFQFLASKSLSASWWIEEYPHGLVCKTSF